MKAYPIELRERILAQWDAGVPVAELAQQFNVDRKTIRNYLALRDSTGALMCRQRGPKRTQKTPEVLAALERLRQADPAATLGQLAERLTEETGVRVTEHTIGDWFRQQGIRFRRRMAADRPSKSTSSEQPRPYRPSGVDGPGYPWYGRRAYPSDLSDAQWELIEPYIPPCKPGGRPQEIERRELVNAMLYLLRTGCPWRALPHDLPHWRTTHYYFHRWQKEGVWAQVVSVLVTKARIQQGRRPRPMIAVMDSQSVPTTEKGGSVVLTASRG
jgi:transposase